MENIAAAIYCRLSQDDGNAGESNSIQTQKALLKQYCAENRIPIAGVYCDDGWSGTNFERPQFKQMMDDIEAGKINVVIVKDDCVIIEPTQKDLENQGFVAGSICF